MGIKNSFENQGIESIAFYLVLKEGSIFGRWEFEIRFTSGSSGLSFINIGYTNLYPDCMTCPLNPFHRGVLSRKFFIDGLPGNFHASGQFILADTFFSHDPQETYQNIPELQPVSVFGII